MATSRKGGCIPAFLRFVTKTNFQNGVFIAEERNGMHAKEKIITEWK